MQQTHSVRKGESPLAACHSTLAAYAAENPSISRIYNHRYYAKSRCLYKMAVFRAVKYMHQVNIDASIAKYV
jgi:hypothetical protein